MQHRGWVRLLRRVWHGFAVALTDADEQNVVATASEIDSSGERVLALQLNVLEKANFSQALQQTIERFGRVDALVNNAALTLTTPVMEISPEEFDKVIAVNQRGTFFGCQVFGQYFADQGYGRIVNLASLAGQNGGAAAGAHYGSTKGAILAMTKIFAAILAASGVTVNAVAPGPMDLPSVRELVPSADKLEQIINEMIPVQELGDAGFVADMVAKLVSRSRPFCYRGHLGYQWWYLHALKAVRLISAGCLQPAMKIFKGEQMNSELIDVIVTGREEQADGVAVFELSRKDGDMLPAFAAGALVDVHVTPEIIRQYSLSNAPGHGNCYRLGILKDPASRGGSIAIHEHFNVGHEFQISAPRNHFPLDTAADSSILVGGGIGVTPMLTMAYALKLKAFRVPLLLP